MRIIKALVFLLCLIMFPISTSGQQLSVDAYSLDFGFIEIGDSATRKLTITTPDPLTPIEFGSFEITNDLYNYFTLSNITYYDARRDETTSGLYWNKIVPAEFYVDDFLYVDVTYTPLSAGIHTAVLEIESNDTHQFPPAGTAKIDLTGGAWPIPEPTTMFLFGACLISLVRTTRRKLKK